VVVAQVPWARHGAGHTRVFDDQVAWLAVACSKSAVCQLMRLAWRTVGAIVARVLADVDRVVDRLDGLRRIGIDEISYKKGHKYLTIVIDHDTGRLVWAGARQRRAGPVLRRAGAQAVRADHACVGRRRGLDRQGRGRTLPAGGACGKIPENLTEHQQAKLAWIAKTSPRLHRAYLLKRACATPSRSKAKPGNRPWTTRAAGHSAAGSRPPSTSAARSNATATPSTPPSSTACPTP
jgi:transposase